MTSGFKGPQKKPRKNAAVASHGSGGSSAIGRMLAAVPTSVIRNIARRDRRALNQP